MLWTQLALMVGLMGGVFLTTTLHRYTDKKFGVILGTGAWAVVQVSPVVLRLTGNFPENGDPLLVTTLITVKFLQGVLLQQAFVSFGSMMAWSPKSTNINQVLDRREFSLAPSRFQLRPLRVWVTL